MISSGGGAKPLRPSPLDPQAIDKKFRDVGDLYEKQFLREMVKQMRATIPEGGMLPTGMGEKIFREQLDQEYVEKWGEQGGIGLSDLIYKQLINKFGEQMGLSPRIDKPSGPLPFSHKEEYRAKFSNSSNQSKDLNVQFTKTGQGENQGGPTSLLSPWRGQLLGAYQLADGFNLIDIQHEDGLRSRLHFKGSLGSLQAGDEISSGQPIGILSPDNSELNWKVTK